MSVIKIMSKPKNRSSHSINNTLVVAVGKISVLIAMFFGSGVGDLSPAVVLLSHGLDLACILHC